MAEKDLETLVRNAWDAYGRGDIEGLLEYVDPNLTWTFLDPSEPAPPGQPGPEPAGRGGHRQR
jgi:ketosteroid isomerase-like protein